MLYYRLIRVRLTNNMNIGKFIDNEVISINEAVIYQIRREVDQAKIHLNDHVNSKGKVLKLHEDCEYCQIHIEEQRILKFS
jgi:biotin synthase-like enzyme